MTGLRRRVLRRGAPALGLGCAALLGGCDVPNFGLPDGATEQSDATTTLWKVAVIAALAVGVLVWFLIIWSIIRYRKRGTSDGEPSQRKYNIPLEIFYTVVPILLVIGLFFGAVAAEHVVDAKTTPDVKITVNGFQWQWQFVYPEDHITITGGGKGAYPELVIPAGKVVQLHLVSKDVDHSFWVPDFLFKRDLIPGVDNVVQFEVKEPGSHVGRCAEFCGLDHYRMDFTVRALPPAAYRRWVDTHRNQQITTSQAFGEPGEGGQ